MRVDRLIDGLAVTVNDESGTARLGEALAAVAGPGVVIGLVGPLGSGKTRLCRAIAEAFGVPPGAISSPTFVLIHEYQGRLPIYHFDTYRLDDPGAFESLGVSDYFDAGGVCLVEWADRVLGLLPPDLWRIDIEPLDGNGRRFLLRIPEEPEGRLRAILGGN